MKDLYSVREFATITGVEASTLRYWDDIGLFSPVKRDPENNYRYYSLAQIIALNFVTVLSDINVPLKTIAILRNERDPENFLKILERRERELDMELRTLRLTSSIIHTREELIRFGLGVDDSRISVEPREDRACILWPRNEYNEGDTIIEPLADFIKRSDEYHVNLAFPIGGYWDDFASFLKEPSRPDHFFSVDPVGKHIIKEGDYLIGYTRGYYAEMGDLPQRLASYVQENSVNVAGPVYVMYLHDEACTQDPSQYLAQFCAAVK